MGEIRECDSDSYLGQARALAAARRSECGAFSPRSYLPVFFLLWQRGKNEKRANDSNIEEKKQATGRALIAGLAHAAVRVATSCASSRDARHSALTFLREMVQATPVPCAASFERNGPRTNFIRTYERLGMRSFCSFFLRLCSFLEKASTVRKTSRL